MSTRTLEKSTTTPGKADKELPLPQEERDWEFKLMGHTYHLTHTAHPNIYFKVEGLTTQYEVIYLPYSRVDFTEKWTIEDYHHEALKSCLCSL